MKQFFIFFIMLLGLGVVTLLPGTSKGMDVADTIKSEKPEGLPTLTVGGGCFWCLESEFRRLEGVVYTESGYAGGHVDHPGYRDVTTGQTGHAEAVQITYNPALISASDLLDYFLRKGHDPTTLNRQGVDEGTQYRSVIFYTTDEEKQRAEAAIASATADKVWKDPIVTTVEKLDQFWEAEAYHQQYYEKYEAETGKKHIRVILKEKKKQAAELLK